VDGRLTADFAHCTVTPNQLRWRPFPIPQRAAAPANGGGGAAAPPRPDGVVEGEDEGEDDEDEDEEQGVDFVRGLSTVCGAGSAAARAGFAVHVYACDASMRDRCLANADGDLLVVPQRGALRVTTEFGRLRAAPGEVLVIQRGIRFSVALEGATAARGSGGGGGGGGGARGYVLELFQGSFELPNLGPVGANGLANPRDFQTPVAWYEHDEFSPQAAAAAAAAAPSSLPVSPRAAGPDATADADANANGNGNGDAAPVSAGGLRPSFTPVPPKARARPFTVVHKLEGQLFAASQPFSPFNVVAWHGNYAPYKYDLARFCPVNSVAFDHPDPSIFTVLTAPGAGPPGTAVADFCVFPPRWAAAGGTFRPPYYHRNVMSEFMGLIRGEYDGKAAAGGFMPGGASLHLAMTPHGPDAASFEAATAGAAEGGGGGGGGGAGASAADAPARVGDGSLAFMFETYLTPRVTPALLSAPNVDRGYYRCWESLRSHFSVERGDGGGIWDGGGGGGGARGTGGGRGASAARTPAPALVPPPPRAAPPDRAARELQRGGAQ